jgi:hypothetical protein
MISLTISKEIPPLSNYTFVTPVGSISGVWKWAVKLAGDSYLGVTIDIFIKFCNKGITAAAPSIPRERGSISGRMQKFTFRILIGK